MTDDPVAAERRLTHIEDSVEHLLADRDEDRKALDDFRREVRTRFDATDSRLLGFAFTVAGSAVVIAATVFFTR